MVGSRLGRHSGIEGRTCWTKPPNCCPEIGTVSVDPVRGLKAIVEVDPSSGSKMFVSSE
jgi:hypothetical protein